MQKRLEILGQTIAGIRANFHDLYGGSALEIKG
jgi:hypothetical protein